ncbi:hypothetical protein [Streptomyces sp. NPDC047028]|uniref:hypothetical protein n=1 Tax=Streptomyces sp. NPDC047028 TaxID=3155793 RepID=UPI0033C9024A
MAGTPAPRRRAPDERRRVRTAGPPSSHLAHAYLIVVGALGGCGALFNALGCYVSIFALDMTS